MSSYYGPGDPRNRGGQSPPRSMMGRGRGIGGLRGGFQQPQQMQMQQPQQMGQWSPALAQQAQMPQRPQWEGMEEHRLIEPQQHPLSRPQREQAPYEDPYKYSDRYRPSGYPTPPPVPAPPPVAPQAPTFAAGQEWKMTIEPASGGGGGGGGGGAIYSDRYKPEGQKSIGWAGGGMIPGYQNGGIIGLRGGGEVPLIYVNGGYIPMYGLGGFLKKAGKGLFKAAKMAAPMVAGAINPALGAGVGALIKGIENKSLSSALMGGVQGYLGGKALSKGLKAANIAGGTGLTAKAMQGMTIPELIKAQEGSLRGGLGALVKGKGLGALAEHGAKYLSDPKKVAMLYPAMAHLSQQQYEQSPEGQIPSAAAAEQQVIMPQSAGAGVMPQSAGPGFVAAQGYAKAADGGLIPIPGYGIGGLLKKLGKVATFGTTQLLPEKIRDPLNKLALKAAPVAANFLPIPGAGPLLSAGVGAVARGIEGKIDADRARDAAASTSEDAGAEAVQPGLQESFDPALVAPQQSRQSVSTQPSFAQGFAGVADGGLIPIPEYRRGGRAGRREDEDEEGGAAPRTRKTRKTKKTRKTRRSRRRKPATQAVPAVQPVAQQLRQSGLTPLTPMPPVQPLQDPTIEYGEENEPDPRIEGFPYTGMPSAAAPPLPPTAAAPPLPPPSPGSWGEDDLDIGDVVPMTTAATPAADIPRIEQVEDPGEDDGDPTSTDPSSYYTPPAWTPPSTANIPIAEDPYQQTDYISYQGTDPSSYYHDPAAKFVVPTDMPDEGEGEGENGQGPISYQGTDPSSYYHDPAAAFVATDVTEYDAEGSDDDYDPALEEKQQQEAVDRRAAAKAAKDAAEQAAKDAAARAAQNARDAAAKAASDARATQATQAAAAAAQATKDAAAAAAAAQAAKDEAARKAKTKTVHPAKQETPYRAGLMAETASKTGGAPITGYDPFNMPTAAQTSQFDPAYSGMFANLGGQQELGAGPAPGGGFGGPAATPLPPAAPPPTTPFPVAPPPVTPLPAGPPPVTSLAEGGPVDPFDPSMIPAESNEEIPVEIEEIVTAAIKGQIPAPQAAQLLNEIRQLFPGLVEDIANRIRVGEMHEGGAESLVEEGFLPPYPDNGPQGDGLVDDQLAIDKSFKDDFEQRLAEGGPMPVRALLAGGEYIVNADDTSAGREELINAAEGIDPRTPPGAAVWDEFVGNINT